MKKIAMVAGIAALMLQSCSTGSMFGKKRYGHLNWIDHDTKVETKGNGLEAVENKQQTKTLDKIEISEKKENTQGIQQPVNNNATIVVNEPATTMAPVQNEQPAQKQTGKDGLFEETYQAPVAVQQQSQISKPEVLQRPEGAQDGSTGMLVLCIILCFFIPPLAMYLWNKTTDMWFWLDLILFLCVILIITGLSLFGLAGLAAFVIALLRVLDVI